LHYQKNKGGKKNMKKIALLLILSMAFALVAHAAPLPIPNPIYGVNVDEKFTVTLDEVVAGLSAMTLKPTARIVFAPKETGADYLSMVTAIHNVAYVLGQPVDSFFEKRTKLAAHKARWTEYLASLKDVVDVWEVMNEVNGSWLGKTEDVVAKMVDAFDQCKAAGVKTELCTYIEDPPSGAAMFAWLDTNCTAAMKSGLDYVMVSYYGDETLPDWPTIMAQLQAMFPNSTIGIAECGFVQKHAIDAEWLALADFYYLMPKYTTHYEGGYFWWYWAEDCLPYAGNAGWAQIDTDCVWMSTHL